MGVWQTYQRNPTQVRPGAVGTLANNESSFSTQSLEYLWYLSTGFGMETWVAPQQEDEMVNTIPPVALWWIIGGMVILGTSLLYRKRVRVFAPLLLIWAYLPAAALIPQWAGRKDIRTLEELRGKTFGVQSIGGGFWLQTMIALDYLGIDAEKYDLKMRILGDTATVTQALGSCGVDATVIPYSFSEAAKRAGANVLADIGKLPIPYQGTTICFLRDSPSHNPDIITRLLKGLVDAVVMIHDPSAKTDVTEILRKSFRFPRLEDAEASYKVLRQMATLDLLPDLAAWKIVQRIVARINPKVTQVDINQLNNPAFVRSLEESGFLADARRKLR
jgi:hypothetical protein